MNGWKNEFWPPFLWALLAFVEVLSFTAIIPSLSPEMAENTVYDLWYILLTATVLRIRTPKGDLNGETKTVA